MKRVAFAGVLLLVLVLSACSTISTGFVTAKKHTDPYTYTQMMCSAWNSRGFCMVWVPNTIYVPEQWRLDLENDGQTGWVYVSEETYDGINVGDVFNGEEK